VTKRQEKKHRKAVGARPQVRAGRGLGLTPERISAAALELIDREGLEALTARRLALALGCEAMSLYHHFPSMEQILDAVADRLLAAAISGTDSPMPQDLRPALLQLASRYLEQAVRHPRAFPLIAGRRLRTPAVQVRIRRLVALLEAHGFAAVAALRWIRVLAAYLNGAALALAAWQREPEPASGSEASANGWSPDVRNRLGAKAVRQDLTEGLDLLLDGIVHSSGGTR